MANVLGVVIDSATRFIPTLLPATIVQISDYHQGWIDATLVYVWFGLGAWLYGNWRHNHRRFFADLAPSLYPSASGFSRLGGCLWHTAWFVAYLLINLAIGLLLLVPELSPF